MEILVVSSKEFASTNRGIDVITQFLSQKHKVTHLQFYVREEKQRKYITDNLCQEYLIDRNRLYRDKFKYFVPGFLIKFMIKKLVESSYYDFSKFDYVILESGYPTLLVDYIDKPIIFRKSDEAETAFNVFRSFFKCVETRLECKALAISTASRPEFWNKKVEPKSVYWKTGYIVPVVDKTKITKKRQVVYMGGTPIEYKVLLNLSKKFSDYKFIIIGNHKQKVKAENIIYTGYLSFNDYKEYIIEASIFFAPFSNKFIKKMNYIELTSKFYLPMMLGIPIIGRAYGLVQESISDYKMFMYKNMQEALDMFAEVIGKIETGKFDFSVSAEAACFLDKQSKENKEKELAQFFEQYLK